MFFRLIASALVILLTMGTASPVFAVDPGLLDQALASARGVAPVQVLASAAGQPGDCAAAGEDGAADAERRQGRGGWIGGGVLLPIIMPIVAHVSSPPAPADAVVRYQGQNLSCYTASYVEAASSRRKSGAWIGSGIGIAAYVALSVIAVSSTDY